MIVAGGGTSSTAEPQSFLDSTEFLVHGEAAWTEINSLKWPTLLRGPFLINVKNDVLLTGLKLFTPFKTLCKYVLKTINNLGGDINGTLNVDTVSKLNQNNLTWEVIGKMKTSRAYHRGSLIEMTKEIIDNCH